MRGVDHVPSVLPFMRLTKPFKDFPSGQNWNRLFGLVPETKPNLPLSPGTPKRGSPLSLFGPTSPSLALTLNMRNHFPILEVRAGISRGQQKWNSPRLLQPVRVRVGDTGAPRCILNRIFYLGRFLASTGFSVDFKFMSPSNTSALHSPFICFLWW